MVASMPFSGPITRRSMGFQNYLFVDTARRERDPRSYLSPAQVIDYLNGYAIEYGLSELVILKLKLLSKKNNNQISKN